MPVIASTAKNHGDELAGPGSKLLQSRLSGVNGSGGRKMETGMAASSAATLVYLRTKQRDTVVSHSPPVTI